MTSIPNTEQEESLFLLDEQPPPNLQKSESFDDDHKYQSLKSMERILSASSAISLSNHQQQQQQPYRSLSAHDLAPALHSNDFGLPPANPSRRSSSTRNSVNDIDTFVRQFEVRLREHRFLWQKEYDATVQRLNEAKANELEALKSRYETKLNTVEDGNKQLEMILEKLNEENQRIKLEMEHQKQQVKADQVIEMHSFFFLY